MLTPDKERVKELLCETITLLCKNGLHFQDEFCIDGLIGITLDQREVFLVTIKETVKHGEVFVRDRQHSTRLQAIEELPHGLGDNQIAAGSEGDSRSELRSDPDSVSRLQDASLKESEREAATVANPVMAKVSRHCQMEIDEEIEVKTEEGDDSRDRVSDNRTTANERRQKSSRVVENVHCPSSHNAESQTSPAAEAEQLHDPSVDRNHEDYLPIVPYNEMNSTATCRDQSKESPDLNSQLSIESSAQSQFSSTDRYYRAATVSRCEDKMASDGCDSGQNSNQKPDAEESDGDELVVVKVEPPSSDYPDDQFSSISSYRQTQANDDAFNFAPDSGYIYNRVKDVAGYPPGKHSHGVTPFDYGGQVAEASVHSSGYNQQFSQSFQMNRYQMKSAMNHGSIQNDTSQSPHSSGLDKNQPNSLLSAMTKPYRRLDYSKGTPEHDLRQMPFPAPPLPDLNNSLVENESSSMMQTDLEKYAEMQNCCMNRRARSTFTAYQLQRLESAFKCAHYVDAGTRSKLAEELNLSDSIILVWFQNRRQKFKKQMKLSFS